MIKDVCSRFLALRADITRNYVPASADIVCLEKPCVCYVSVEVEDIRRNGKIEFVQLDVLVVHVVLLKHYIAF